MCVLRDAKHVAPLLLSAIFVTWKQKRKGRNFLEVLLVFQRQGTHKWRASIYPSDDTWVAYLREQLTLETVGEQNAPFVATASTYNLYLGSSTFHTDYLLTPQYSLCLFLPLSFLPETTLRLLCSRYTSLPPFQGFLTPIPSTCFAPLCSVWGLPLLLSTLHNCSFAPVITYLGI